MQKGLILATEPWETEILKKSIARDKIYFCKRFYLSNQFYFFTSNTLFFCFTKKSGIFTEANYDYFSIPLSLYYKYMIKENQSRSSVNQMLSRQLVQTRNANFFKGWSCTKRSGTHDWYPTLQQLPSMRNSGSPNKQENSIPPFLSFPVPL